MSRDTLQDTQDNVEQRQNEILWGDNIELMRSFPDNYFSSMVTDPPYGIKFMGKKWDYEIPSIETWEEAYRVLKPGAHILVACGTKTQHRMAVNIEDAGFEIRDIVAWVQGQGFPKNHNIGKSVEATLKTGKSNSRALRQVEQEGDGKPYKLRGKNNGILGEDRVYDRKEFHAETKEAKQWTGWGTALKPSMELWTLARKPLSESTIAKNVLKHGTGGINVDASRVPFEETKNAATNPLYRQENKERYKQVKGGEDSKGVTTFVSGKNGVSKQGRHPANLIHDGSREVLQHFPHTKSSKGSFKADDYKQGTGVTNFTRGDFEGYGDEGSAARFFYVPKPGKKEKNLGLEKTELKNTHPTVKPIDLMGYLITMITPPQGIVLDPFAGSGSTLIGATQANIKYIGMELDKDYHSIASTRLKNIKQDNE